jgi:uncharacterized protein
VPTASILDMFATSPVRPLQKHMHEAVNAAEYVLPFFEAVVAENWPEAERNRELICDAEHKADALKRDLRVHLPKGLFMSMSRSDILGLLKAQEKLANVAKDIAGLVLGRRLQVPQAMTEPFLAFVRCSVEAVKQAHRAIAKVDELMEIGFKGVEADKIESFIHRLDDIESETDNQQIDLRDQLFVLESDLAAVNVMFLYKTIEKVGSLADYAQEVGGRLVLLLAR